MKIEDKQFDEDTRYFATFEDRSSTYFTCHSMILFILPILALIIAMAIAYSSVIR
ncbi:MAG: hypothetical protein ACW99U_08685 [Candidatus Thorarchaeota archaeon]